MDDRKKPKKPILLVPCHDMADGRARAVEALRDIIGAGAGVDITSDISKLENQSLFGSEPLIIATESRNDIGGLAAADLSVRAGDGLAIVTNCNGATSEMKALKETVKRAGGVTLDRDADMSSVIDSLPLRKDLKTFLHEYTSDSHDKANPICLMVSAMDPEEAESMTMDDIMARIPQTPGERLPWGHGYGRNHVKGLDEFLLDRDSGGALDLMDRVLSGGANANMVVSWLRKTWREDMRITAMVASGDDWSSIAHTLGLPDPRYRGKGEKDPATGRSGYPTYSRIRSCSGKPLRMMMNTMDAILHADSALKGGTMEIMDDSEIMTRMVVKACA